MVRVCKRQKIRSVQQLIAHAEAVNAAFYRRRCVKFERERERERERHRLSVVV